ncbi:unnamed protein product [Adineta steineri]|uniref:Methyltransferase FkbM domain-containing protein n=1 Tax=Adineta steineri TaxID=433720 RepID=A0A818Q934_9BILA|nr:unnamed protein product [Adineta steineri]
MNYIHRRTISFQNLNSFLTLYRQDQDQHRLISTPFSSVFYCTKGESENQGKVYQEELRRNALWTACYAEDYIIQLYLADLGTTRERRKLLFDVGSNKGYVLAAWKSIWSPQNGVNQRSLGKYLSEKLLLSDCGVCNDCNEPLLSTKVNISRHMNVSVEIHAFEPQLSNYGILHQVQKWTNDTYLYVHNLAISNHTGTAVLLKCGRGGEACGLTVEKNLTDTERFLLVNVTTLDTFVQKFQITEIIDILKIDTEGYDPLVLTGANLIFKRQQIRLLIFEHHHVGFWASIHLRDVVENLDSKGYTCYMFGKTGLIRITRCWSSLFAEKRWSNVLCVLRNDERLRYFIEKLLISSTL